MSASRDWVFPKCPECGARGSSTARQCWMCHAAMPQTSLKASSPSAPVKASVSARRPTVFVATRDASPKHRIAGSKPTGEDAWTARWLLFGLAAALGAVGLGLWARAPGFAVLYVLVISPAVIAMFVSLDREKAAGSGRSAADFVDRGLSILVKTVLIVWLVSGAAVFALCIFCFVTIFGIFGR